MAVFVANVPFNPTTLQARYANAEADIVEVPGGVRINITNPMSHH